MALLRLAFDVGRSRRRPQRGLERRDDMKNWCSDGRDGNGGARNQGSATQSLRFRSIKLPGPSDNSVRAGRLRGVLLSRPASLARSSVGRKSGPDRARVVRNENDPAIARPQGRYRDRCCSKMVAALIR